MCGEQFHSMRVYVAESPSILNLARRDQLVPIVITSEPHSAKRKLHVASNVNCLNISLTRLDCLDRKSLENLHNNQRSKEITAEIYTHHTHTRKKINKETIENLASFSSVGIFVVSLVWRMRE